MPELLDIYDDSMVRIGVKPRDEVHRDGDWHRVFHCWVIYRDSSGLDWVILQKRSVDKQTWPNYLDVSAAGHYEAGETPAEGLRELEEELGLQVELDDLLFVGRRVTMMKEGFVLDREVADVHILIHEQPLAEYRYQEDELSGLIALNIEQGLELFSGEITALDVPAHGFSSPTIEITIADFVPTIDDYYYKVLILAQRCLNGEKHLRI